MSHTLKIGRYSTLAACPDCNSTHMAPVPCGLSYMQRLRSSQLHPDATPSREKRKYWDQEALDNQFGEDAREHSLDITKGRGLNEQASLAELF